MNWYSLFMWIAILWVGLTAGPVISYIHKRRNRANAKFVKQLILANSTSVPRHSTGGVLAEVESTLKSIDVVLDISRSREIVEYILRRNQALKEKEKSMTASSGYVTEWKRLKEVLDDMERNPEKSDPRSVNKIRTVMIQYFNRMTPTEQKEMAKLYIPDSPIEENGNSKNNKMK